MLRVGKEIAKIMVKILYIYTTVYMDILKYIHIYLHICTYTVPIHMHTAVGWMLLVTASMSWPQHTFGIIRTSNVQPQCCVPWQSLEI